MDNNLKICKIHNQKIILICIEENCKEPVLCSKCYKSHNGDHLKNCKTLEEIFSNGKYEENIYIELLNKKNEDSQFFIDHISELSKKFCNDINVESNSLQTNIIDALRLSNPKIDNLIKEIPILKDQHSQPTIENILLVLRKIQSLEINLEEHRDNTIEPLIREFEEHFNKINSLIKNQNLDFTLKLKNRKLNSITKRLPHFSNSQELAKLPTGRILFVGSNILHIPGWSASNLFFYKTLLNQQVDRALTISPQTCGTYQVFHLGALYFVKFTNNSTNVIVKYDIINNKIIKESILEKALSNNSHNSYGGYNDINLMTSLGSLYVVYATEENEKRITISMLNPEDLTVIKTWNTNSLPKKKCCPIFMIDKVLYHLDYYNSSPGKIIYSYDVDKELTSKLDIPFENKGGYDTSLYFEETSNCMITINSGVVYKYEFIK